MRRASTLCAILAPWAFFLTCGELPAADEPLPQSRPHGVRVLVPIETIRIDDGDTLVIRWKEGELETVRILGIDSPEIRHVEHGIPFDQPFGREAAAFARGALALADKVELRRAATLDPYGRTLGYIYVNGRNFSVLILSARLAVQTVSVFGDNGLPEEAAACVTAATAAGAVPFEPPYLFRKRMREVAEQMRAEGQLPIRE